MCVVITKAHSPYPIKYECFRVRYDQRYGKEGGGVVLFFTTGSKAVTSRTSHSATHLLNDFTEYAWRSVVNYCMADSCREI